ncbi:Eco57I restriction-modification methylase domain-containing protein [Lacticaseibacillus pantheris]|nr:Eco57I restriction-modification methylase domain-containing protein [Lacticaseibacillus pantheris]
MLWNAKMRFGKTLSALQLIKNQQYSRVLIMTHRPVVRDSWFKDFDKLGMPGYRYGSKQKHDASLEQLVDDGGRFLYFASMQDLRGSEWAGGKAGDKNELIAKIDWNLVIIDEAHEGTQTDLAQAVIKGVVKDATRVLELSGTPFNLIDGYEPEQIFTWDYTMEQQAKAHWNVDNPDEVNPYAVLPKVSMFTFEMKNSFQDSRFLDFDQKSFDFHEFFKVDDNGRFVYETKVNQFLNNITSPSKNTNFPYSTEKFRNELRHTLWLLPSIAAAKALKALMEKHPVFGMEYTIVNVVDDGKEDGASEGDLNRVRDAITKHPSKTKTITLTVRKLTTGVNIPQWTAVMFLSNTNSAMQYLQAAFRAQTPYADKEMGMKTDCYIFDFAPDRALNVMAASSQLDTGAGKLQTDDQKEKMGELLNFLPIIGEQNQGMAPYNVDSLMTQLKKVYAEKAVRTGFDDDSLYNDELLKMDEADLKDFNDLKAEIGTTKAQKKPNTIDVNHQGLTDREYNDAEKAKKKHKKDLTTEEKELLEKERALKKQRKTMISVLRSISIRIPMMIYGMDIPIERDIDIQTFVDKVDAESWAEFMPKGVDKAKFKKFSKYYDANIFIEAGRIIRQRVKRMDHMEPLRRTADIGELFGTFKNPDKETVLTPWRVVNMQLGKTVGGYSYFDTTYNYTSIDGDNATHWVDTEMTKDIFKPDTRILEINSKTGLYPLYAATSLYYQEQARLSERTGGKFTAKDEDEIWRNILAKNIFAIAKTPMAKRITNRTLCGYHEFGTNVVYVDGIVEKAKNSNDETVQYVLDAFKERIVNQMKFDVVIGNPPYQESERGDSKSKKSIYQYFMELSYQLSEKSIMITPARFLFNAGDTSSIWNEKMLNDSHLRVVMFEKHSGNIFPKTDIKGGVAITLRDTTKEFGKIGTFTQFDELRPILDKVRSKRTDTLNSIGFSRTIYRLTDKLHQDFPDAIERLSAGHKYDMSSNIMKLLPEVFYHNKPDDGNQYIRILGKPKDTRIEEWIRRDYVTDRPGLDKYNVFLASAIGSGEFGEPLSDMYIAEPGVGHTETFISIGAFDTRFEAESAEKYLKTKFARTMLGIWKVTQNGPISTYREIPVQNFTQDSDIDWKTSIRDIDNQLFVKYELSDDEVQFINTHVEEMN